MSFRDQFHEFSPFDYKLGHLYTHQFEKGRFFNVVWRDENCIRIQTSSRIWLQLTYLNEKEDIEGFKVSKIDIKSNGDEEQKGEISLSKFNLAQLKIFLEFINSIDLKDISLRRISLSDGSLDKLDATAKRKIATLLSGSEGGELIAEWLDNGELKHQDLVNTGYRRAQLELFEKLLYENGLDNYKNEVMHKQNTKDETAWQHFFQHNDWIFGYGLDYKFQRILQKEFCASSSDAAGKGVVKADYLLGDTRFTTFVELKLPSTPLFGTSKNRSNAWRLSDELLEAYSQILEQKASGQLRLEKDRPLFDENEEEIKQHAYDSKSILIIGCWDEIQSEKAPKTKAIKEKTFELFRRDSRNVEIITYDELYERATFIVESGRKNNSQAR